MCKYGKCENRNLIGKSIKIIFYHKLVSSELKIVLKHTFSNSVILSPSDDDTGCNEKEAGLKGKKVTNPSYK